MITIWPRFNAFTRARSARLAGDAESGRQRGILIPIHFDKINLYVARWSRSAARPHIFGTHFSPFLTFTFMAHKLLPFKSNRDDEIETTDPRPGHRSEGEEHSEPFAHA